MPTPSPSTAPSSNPTGFEDLNGYYRQLDRPLKVACAGDSLTRGRDNGNTEADTYPFQLGQLLGGDFGVYNFGVNAVTAMRDLPLSYVDRQEFQESLNVEPDIYLLMLGTNDSRYWEEHAPRYPASLRWIINEVQSLASSPRIILAIPPWVKYNIRGIRNNIISNNVRVEIERVAREFNLHVVDMQEVTVNQNEYLVQDGLHYNQKGYGAIAEVWRQAIECDNNGICEAGESCETCPGDCYLNCPSRGQQ